VKHYWEWMLHAPEDGTGAGDGGKRPDGGDGGAGDGGEAAAAATAAAAAGVGDGSGDDGAGDGAGGDGGKKAKTSIYDDAGVEEPGKEGSAAWPDDWRQQIAKGDEKKLKHLERYASPEAVIESKFAMNQKVSSGEYKRVLPEDADEATIKEWRTEQGIPEAPENYELPVTLDGDIADMNEGQKAVYESWQQTFHELNLPNDVAVGLTEHGNRIVEAHLEAQAEADAQHLDAFEDTLRSEWGSEFRVNGKMNVRYLTDTLGSAEAAKSIMDARMPDGKMLKNHTEFSKLLNSAARASGITGSMETGETSGMTDKAGRKAEIEKLIGGPEYTPDVRKEYGEILAAMEGKQEIAV